MAQMSFDHPCRSPVKHTMPESDSYNSLQIEGLHMACLERYRDRHLATNGVQYLIMEDLFSAELRSYLSKCQEVRVKLNTAIDSSVEFEEIDRLMLAQRRERIVGRRTATQTPKLSKTQLTCWEE